MPKLVLSSRAAATDQVRSDYVEVRDPGVLSNLHGFHSESLCADYFEEEALIQLGAQGGRLRFSYDQAHGELRIATAYELPHKLSSEQTDILAQFTVAQWSDGMGSGSFINNHNHEVLSIWLALCMHRQGNPVGEIFLDARPDSDADVLTEWFETGGYDDDLVADLISEAQAGDSMSQIKLALRYRWGNGVEQDEDKAFHLVKSASASGNQMGDAFLGAYYYSGIGTKTNVAKAVQHLEIAAKAGIPLAMGYLADCYMDGNGVPQDKKRAFDLLSSAAALGDIVALREKGECYELGKGTEINLHNALVCYERCLKAGMEDVQDAIERVKQSIETKRKDQA